MLPPTATDWSSLQGLPPNEPLIELAEQLTGAMAEVEVVRILAEEIERRVQPRHWYLLVGDREELRVEHLGGQASASLLRAKIGTTEECLHRALDNFEGQVVLNPTENDLGPFRTPAPAPTDLVIVPFGGYEVMGCLVMTDALQFNPSIEDLVALRHALRLGGVGIRNAKRHTQLSDGDTLDIVTGLAGPNRFIATLQSELERTKRTKRPTSVLLIDLDNFHTVNDEHGRLVGTSLLAEVGAVLQSAIRRIDMASRWAGDTFALLLPETGNDWVVTVARRLQDRIRLSRFDVGLDKPLGLTASIGIAVYEDSPLDAERRLHDTEMLMRRAQAEGTKEALVIVEPAL